MKNLRLPEETQLIVECRALLTSYDDFMFGLGLNAALHERLEQQYNNKLAQLQASYEEQRRQLLLIAERNGLSLEVLREIPPTLMMPEPAQPHD
jgi:hypothetical protein